MTTWRGGHQTKGAHNLKGENIKGKPKLHFLRLTTSQSNALCMRSTKNVDWLAKQTSQPAQDLICVKVILQTADKVFLHAVDIAKKCCFCAFATDCC